MKFIDDISIFADTPEGMQKLLNVVPEIWVTAVKMFAPVNN